MPDPARYRPRPGEIPLDPGVYRFRDKDGRVIYVGKAKSLRPRLSSYFQDLSGLHPRTRSMVQTGASVEWTVVANEVEALQLEYTWIKAHDPRFNVKYRDDKSYPYLAVTMGEDYPRAQVLRGAKRAGTRYFGPYAHAWAIRETLDQLLRAFPLRTCSNGVFRRAGQVGRPCLLGYIDKCSAPCVGRVDEAEHRGIAEDFCDFMSGSTTPYVRRLEIRMRQASAELEFERAARLRDDIEALHKALERSAMVLPDGTDADVYAMVGDELEAAVQVFHVRGGRVRGQRGWILERQDEDDASLVEHLLQQVYGAEAAESVPREVLVPVLPTQPEAVAAWLTVLRGAAVSVRVPRRGDKKSLQETVQRNAEQALARHKVARAGDLTARSQALQELQDGLGLEEAPLRIECYDVSHVQGTHPVASMVVFEDGLPRKSEYRRFVIRGTVPAGLSTDPGVDASADPTPTRADDTAAMREVLVRRFRRLSPGPETEEGTAEGLQTSQPGTVHGSGADGTQAEDPPDQDTQPEGSAPSLTGVGAAPIGLDEVTGRPKRFAYPPQLIVVDGGLPQVNAAAAALAEVGAGDVQVVGLAKRLEEVWLPGEQFPVVLPRTSDGLFLLQRLRDEAHRFAITLHRKRRARAMTASELDEVPGLGPARRSALLKRFGSVKRIRAASVADLRDVAGIGPALAETIKARLSARDATVPPGVNLSTGEVLE